LKKIPNRGIFVSTKAKYIQSHTIKYLENMTFSRLVIVLFAVAIFYSCSKDQQMRNLLPAIQAINLEEAPDSEPAIVVASDLPESPETKERQLIAYSESSVPPPIISKSTSSIIVEDTIGMLQMEGDVNCGTDPRTVHVINAVRLKPGEYYCQSFSDNRLLRINGLTADVEGGFGEPGQSFNAGEYEIVPNGEDEVCIVAKSNFPNDKTCFSTIDARVCIYREDGQLHVAELPLDGAGRRVSLQ